MFCCSWNPFKGRRRRREEWGERWLVKVVVVGDSRSGKTSLIQRYSSGTLPLTYTPTLFDTTTVTSMVGDRKVQMIIQDTAGQEDLGRLRPPFYFHADVVIVCFSLDRPDGWDKVRKLWVPEARRYCGKHVPLLLVANKADQVSGRPSCSLPRNDDDDDHDDHDDDSHQGQGITGFAVAEDRLNASSVEEEGGLCADNPAFREAAGAPANNNDEDRKETGGDGVPGSPRDSGFFDWADNVPAPGDGLPHEEKRSLLQNGQAGGSSSSSSRRVGGDRKSLPHDGEGGGGGRRGGGRRGEGEGGAAGHDRVDAGQQSGHSVARQVGAAGYFETSAVLDRGIERVFETALTAAMASRQWRKKYRL